MIPHDTSYIKYKPFSREIPDSMCIGIVGDISSEEKGRRIVKNIIKQYGNKVKIRLIGTDKKSLVFCRGKYLKKMGHYNVEKLQSILYAEKVSVIVFPSLVPETFSYLVSELIATDIPILCFNLGAQAEKVDIYDKGVVCDSEREMYDYLEKLYKKEFLKYNANISFK